MVFHRPAGLSVRRAAGLLLLTLALPAVAADLGTHLETLAPGDAFPGADRVVMPAHGDLPVADAFADGRKVGHLFVTSDLVDATGYSGKPISILVGIDLDGVIRSARLMEHHEPIVLIGIPERRVAEVIDGYVGLDVVALEGATTAGRDVDIVSGATVTIMVIDDSIVRAGLKVARAVGLGGPASGAEPRAPPRRVDMSRDEVRDWWDLVADGSVRRLKLTVGDVNRAFLEGGDPVAIERPEPGEPDDLFMEMYAAVVSVPGIGRSLLGDAEYRNLVNTLAPGEQAIVLAGAGRYSFKGSRLRSWRHLRPIPRRAGRAIRPIPGSPAQAPAARGGARRARLRRGGPVPHRRRERLPGGRAVARGAAGEPRHRGAHQGVPGRWSSTTPCPRRGCWRPSPRRRPRRPPAGRRGTETERRCGRGCGARRSARSRVLGAALAALTVAFFFQMSLVRRPALARKVRIGFLLFTLIVLGWYFNAQLSVVNILTVFNALVSGFDWGYFLMEPLVFILWGSVAAALVFWGRGAYCGWLCPFGALQELTNRLARRLGVPQIRVPWAVHERLVALKYLIFLALFGVSLHSLALAERLAEVEPFKTAVIMKFDRAWPFVAFAAALLGIGLFIERAYCRYLCGLGAALAIPARIRTFEWLKRYRQCGNPCQRCANECMVQAIHPEGHINPNRMPVLPALPGGLRRRPPLPRDDCETREARAPRARRHPGEQRADSEDSRRSEEREGAEAHRRANRLMNPVGSARLAGGCGRRLPPRGVAGAHEPGRAGTVRGCRNASGRFTQS